MFREMRAKLQHPKIQTRPIIYYCSKEHVTNSALNLALFLFLEVGYTPEEAIAPFTSISPCPLERYTDATWEAPTYKLEIMSCITGLQKAIEAGFLSGCISASSFVDNFDCNGYEEFDDPLVLNMNQVCELCYRYRSKAEFIAKMCFGNTMSRHANVPIPLASLLAPADDDLHMPGQ